MARIHNPILHILPFLIPIGVFNLALESWPESPGWVEGFRQ